MSTEQKKKPGAAKKIILAILLVILIAGGIYGFQLYKIYFAPNTTGKEKYLFVKTGYTMNDLMKDLALKDILKDQETFFQAAVKMNLPGSLKSGRYRLTKGANNRSIINMLKAGNQDPVKLKFQNIRKKEDFAAYLSANLEPDSLTFITLMNSEIVQEQYGFNKDNNYVMFVPNTYEMYWNISASDFLKKMHDEYEKFWNAERKQKAAALNLTPIQVSILASIVDAEALYDKEMPIIADLYLNRLNKGILLQADPTVIFANDDFTVKRVTNALLQVQSKYNTYKYAGLPPGPIMMPSIKAIDAVLNHENNDYIYMCAKEDFSGYHNFAVTKAEHEQNAKKYRDALNKRNIYK
jgi:UPF0755 protein